jgi:replication factor C subunit 1
MDGIITLSGIDKSTVLAKFPNAKIVSWASHIDTLITNDNDSWKLRQARKKNIPILQWSSLLTLNNDLWVDKYSPKKASDIIGNDSGCKELYDWLKLWDTGFPTKRSILITGPPGIGKTTSAHLITKHCKYSVIEMNASCIRNGSIIKELFMEAMNSRHVGNRRVLIMDEVDGMSSGDRGGIVTLADLLKTCTFPVICIANERGSTKLRPLNSVCEEIKFNRPQKGTIAKVLMETIVKAENLMLTKNTVEEICEKNGNDIRATINYLQVSGIGGMKDSCHRLDPWSATKLLFCREESFMNRADHVYIDTSMIPLMVSEAYIHATEKSRSSTIDKLQRCVDASNQLSLYDLLDTRIHRNQQWGLLPAATIAVSAAASATCGPAPFQLFPSYLGKMSKRGKHTNSYKELGSILHCSTSEIIDSVGLLRTRLYGAKNAATICSELQKLGLSRDIMFDTLGDTVFTGDETTINMESKLKAEITRLWKKLNIETVAEAPKKNDDIYESDDDDNIF